MVAQPHLPPDPLARRAEAADVAYRAWQEAQDYADRLHRAYVAADAEVRRMVGVPGVGPMPAPDRRLRRHGPTLRLVAGGTTG